MGIGSSGDKPKFNDDRVQPKPDLPKSARDDASAKALHEVNKPPEKQAAGSDARLSDQQAKLQQDCKALLLKRAQLAWNAKNFDGIDLKSCDVNQALALFLAGPHMYKKHGKDWAEHYGENATKTVKPVVTWFNSSFRPGVPDSIADAPTDPATQKAFAHGRNTFVNAMHGIWDRYDKDIVESLKIGDKDLCAAYGAYMLTPWGYKFWGHDTAEWLGRQAMLNGLAPITGAFSEASEQIQKHFANVTSEATGSALAGAGFGFVAKRFPVVELPLVAASTLAVGKEQLFDRKERNDLLGRTFWSADQMTNGQLVKAFAQNAKLVGPDAYHSALMILAGGEGYHPGAELGTAARAAYKPGQFTGPLKTFAAGVKSGAENLGQHLQNTLGPGRVLAPAYGDIGAIPSTPVKADYTHAMSGGGKWLSDLVNKKPKSGKLAVEEKVKATLISTAVETPPPHVDQSKPKAESTQPTKDANRNETEKDQKTQLEVSEKRLVDEGKHDTKAAEAHAQKPHTENAHSEAGGEHDTVAKGGRIGLYSPEAAFESKFAAALTEQQAVLAKMKGHFGKPMEFGRSLLDANTLKGGDLDPPGYCRSRGADGSFFDNYGDFYRLTEQNGNAHVKVDKQKWPHEVKGEPGTINYANSQGQVLEISRNANVRKLTADREHAIATYQQNGRWTETVPDRAGGTKIITHENKFPTEFRARREPPRSYDDLVLRNQVDEMRNDMKNNREAEDAARRKHREDPSAEPPTEIRYPDHRRLITSNHLIGGDYDPVPYERMKFPNGTVLEDYKDFQRLTSADGTVRVHVNEVRSGESGWRFKQNNLNDRVYINERNEILEVKPTGQVWIKPKAGENPSVRYNLDGHWEKRSVVDDRLYPIDKGELPAEVAANKPAPKEVKKLVPRESRKLVQPKNPLEPSKLVQAKDPLEYKNTAAAAESKEAMPPEAHQLLGKLSDVTAPALKGQEVIEHPLEDRPPVEADANQSVAPGASASEKASEIAKPPDRGAEGSKLSGPQDMPPDKLASQRSVPHHTPLDKPTPEQSVPHDMPLSAEAKEPPTALDELWNEVKSQAEHPTHRAPIDGPSKSLEDIFAETGWKLHRSKEFDMLQGPNNKGYIRYENGNWHEHLESGEWRECNPKEGAFNVLTHRNFRPAADEAPFFEFDDGKMVFQGKDHSRLYEPGSKPGSPGTNKFDFTNGDRYVIDENLKVTQIASGKITGPLDNSIAESWHWAGKNKLDIELKPGHSYEKIRVHIPTQRVQLAKPGMPLEVTQVPFAKLDPSLQELVTQHVEDLKQITEQVKHPYPKPIEEFLERSKLEKAAHEKASAEKVAQEKLAPQAALMTNESAAAQSSEKQARSALDQLFDDWKDTLGHSGENNLFDRPITDPFADAHYQHPFIKPVEGLAELSGQQAASENAAAKAAASAKESAPGQASQKDSQPISGQPFDPVKNKAEHSAQKGLFDGAAKTADELFADTHGEHPYLKPIEGLPEGSKFEQAAAENKTLGKSAEPKIEVPLSPRQEALAELKDFGIADYQVEKDNFGKMITIQLDRSAGHGVHGKIVWRMGDANPPSLYNKSGTLITDYHWTTDPLHYRNIYMKPTEAIIKQLDL